MAAKAPEKYLIIRLSSIGDIVLTTPVVRSLKKARPGAEVHYLTKAGYAPLLDHNPYIDQLHLFHGSIKKMIPGLQEEGFSHIIDLHKNLRSLQYRWHLGVKASTFDKVNYQKFLLTNFKINKLPAVHIVDRYAIALRPLGIELDGDGLDFFLPEAIEWAGRDRVAKFSPQETPVAVVLGGQQATKKWPAEYFPDLLNGLGLPVLLLGGKTEEEDAARIEEKLKVPVLNSVAKQGLLESAAMMKACRFVIAHDTGFMHIAAAFRMKIFSIWGNTVPAFGMYPYKTDNTFLEVENLSCRPCSKLGYAKCPKGHFRCMRDQTPERVLQVIRAELGV